MRILTISAYYPPYVYGGYEIRVSNVMDELARRGHEICILSTHADTNLVVDPQNFAYPVQRVLHGASRRMHFADRLTKHKLSNRVGVGLVFIQHLVFGACDLRCIEQEIERFQPDLLYLGHILPLSEELMPFLARQNVRIVADEGYMTLRLIWQEHGLWQRFQKEYLEKNKFQKKMKEIISNLVECFSGGRICTKWTWPENISAIFNSELNLRIAQEGNVPLTRAEVIHSGIDTTFFSFKREKTFGSPLTIFMPGRIERQKGQMDVLQLFASLIGRGIDGRLLFIGERWNETFARDLEERVDSLGLSDKVRLLAPVGRAEMVSYYHSADICFFASHHKTGFSRIPLEAMACGALVFSYGNEGTDEIIRDEENGFLLPQGDLDSSVELINRLLVNPELSRAVIMRARNEIEAKYSFMGYVDQVATFLQSCLYSPIRY